MNNDDVKQAVLDLITDNSATLLTGLSKQGEDREIATASKSSLSPPQNYYYVNVRIPDAREFSRPATSRTTRQPTRWAEYDIELNIVDSAEQESGETNPYEHIHSEGDKFTDRIVKLVKEQDFITGTTVKLELKRQPGEGDRLVQKLDFSGTALDIERDLWAPIFFQIKFTVVDKCVDDSALYS